MAVTPTAHWLEYVDWAAPLLAQPLEIRDGHAWPASRPGNGLEWDADAVERFRMAG
jgi:mandelate racemase